MHSTAVPTSGQARINFKRRQRAAFWNPAATHTIWTGDRDRFATPYQTRLVSWLRANGIDTSRVDADSPITTDDCTVTFTQFRRNKAGRPFSDGKHPLAVRRRTVPLRLTFQPAALAEINRLTTTSQEG